LGENGLIAGRIALVEELGENHLLYVDTDQGARLTARAPGDARHKIGERASLNFSGTSCHLFRSSGEVVSQGMLEGAAHRNRPDPA